MNTLPNDLNLLDYFAAKAMQALIATYNEEVKGGGVTFLKEQRSGEVARAAYSIADAMMKVRMIHNMPDDLWKKPRRMGDDSGSERTSE